MADPTLLVDVEWDAGVWTPEASRVRAWDTNRGRRFELDAFVAGVATVVFENADRRYDPTYTAGPLFGKLKPNRRLRIRTVWDGVTRGVFFGSIDRIEQTYAPPHVATATVTCTDAFKQLGRAVLPGSVYEAEIAGTTFAWWRMGDTIGSPIAADWVGQRHATGGGTNPGTTPVFGQPGLVARDPTTSVTFTVDDTTGSYLEVPASVTPLGSGGGIPTWSIGFVMRNDGGQVVNQYVYWQTAGDSGADPNQISVYLYNTLHGSAGKLGATIINSTGGNLSVTSTVRVDDGNPHQVHVVYNGGTDLRIYVDGAAAGVGAGIAATTVNPPTRRLIGNAWFGDADTYWWRGNLQEFALYGVPLAAATVAEIAAARKTGGQWAGDTSGARVNRILGEVGYAGARSVDAGNSVLQSTDLGGSALRYLQTIETSEGGRLYVDAEGVLTFVGRHNTFNPPAGAEYGDAGAALGYTDIGYVRDEAMIRNEVALSRLGGTTYRQRDATSVAEYGLMGYVEEGLFLASDVELMDRAAFLLGQYKDPSDRIGTLAVNPYADPAALFPRVLGDDIGDRVTVTRWPQDVGDPYTADYVIDAVRHQWAPKQWRTTYGLAPLSTTAGSGDFLQLDDTDGAGLDGVRLAY